jgi:hypothetical protein
MTASPFDGLLMPSKRRTTELQRLAAVRCSLLSRSTVTTADERVIIIDTLVKGREHLHYSADY